MLKERLSSDNLYHFKSDPEVLKLILKYGFRHGMWSETLPYKKSEQHNFIVCFCDIRIEDTKYHRKVYGDNAIVLTKEWGKKNGVSPVRYIHENSAGVSSDYIKSKNNFREIRANAQDHPDTVLMDYSIFSVLLDHGRLPFETIMENVAADPTLGDKMEALENEFHSLLSTLKASNQDKIFTKFLHSLSNRISNLHNELERRDSFMRVYAEDFTHPATKITVKNKVLYDEKEWRSIKYANSTDYIEAITNEFLPPSYNLKFSDNDVLAILLKDEVTLENTKQFINQNQTLLNPDLTLEKLMLIDQYQEG